MESPIPFKIRRLLALLPPSRPSHHRTSWSNSQTLAHLSPFSSPFELVKPSHSPTFLSIQTLPDISLLQNHDPPPCGRAGLSPRSPPLICTLDTSAPILPFSRHPRSLIFSASSHSLSLPSSSRPPLILTTSSRPLVLLWSTIVAIGMAIPSTRYQPYDTVAALIRHINQRNKEIMRQNHSPDQYKALYGRLNIERPLPENDADVTKNNIYNITKKWLWYSCLLAILSNHIRANLYLGIVNIQERGTKKKYFKSMIRPR